MKESEVAIGMYLVILLSKKTLQIVYKINLYYHEFKVYIK